MSDKEYFSEDHKIRYTITDEGIEICEYTADDKSVEIPAYIEGRPVRMIQPYAFSKKNMKYISFPNTLIKIDHHAFSECRELKTLVFPDSLEWIGNYAFYNCYGLGKVHLTARISSIGFGAFKNCENIHEIIQDKSPEHDISIGSLLDDLDQRIHVIMRHFESDGSIREARVIFPEHHYEIVANVASMCKQFESTEVGSGKYMRYCMGIKGVDYIKYDNMFYVLLRGDPFETVITVAIERLMYPYGLTLEGAARYKEYIKEHSAQALRFFIERDDMEKFSYLLSLEVCNKSDIDDSLEICARREKPDYTSKLMDYTHKHFNMADEEFVL